MFVNQIYGLRGPGFSTKLYREMMLV